MHGFFFNILHYVVVLLVFTAIVSGIIIDSFAELRAAREATRLDILHVCFVCDIDREDFETLGTNTPPAPAQGVAYCNAERGARCVAADPTLALALTLALTIAFTPTPTPNPHPNPNP